MQPFLDEIEKGYCYKQAADRLGYRRAWVLNTLHSDDRLFALTIDLAMQASALIKSGALAAPADRYDGLYNDCVYYSHEYNPYANI